MHLALSRASYRQRAYREAVAMREATSSTNEQTFYVPEGTQELLVSWIGESFGQDQVVIMSTEEFAPLCTFEQIDKHLVDPWGNSRGEIVVPEEMEVEYFTKTLRVVNPEAGQWTMMANAPFACVADNVYYTGHVPMLGQVAYVKGSPVEGALKITPAIAKLDEPVTIEATLKQGAEHVMTGLSVNTTVSIGDDVSVVTMRDDGEGGDPVAGDGVYIGVFNDSGATPEPGIRRVVVTMTALAGQAQTVVKKGVHPDPLENPPAIPTSVVLEKSLYIEDCGRDLAGNLIPNCTEACGFDDSGTPVAGCDMSHCEPDDAECVGIPGETVCANEPFTIHPGETAYDLELVVRGHAIGDRRVSVSIGPGVRAFVTATSYDAEMDESTVVFNATATSTAVPVVGEVPVTVGFAGKIYKGKLDYCDAGDVPPSGRYGLYVTNSLTANDRVLLDCPTAYNAGYGQVHVGVEAVTGSIQSNGHVHVANNADILGGIYTADTVSFTDINTVEILDGYFEHQNLAFADLGTDSLDWVVFPPEVALPPLNPSPTPVLLSPASYPDVVLNSGVTILLSSGTYYFKRLVVNSAAHILIDDTLGWSFAIFT